MDFLRKANIVFIVILHLALFYHTYRVSKWISREPPEGLRRDRRNLWTHIVLLLVTSVMLFVITARVFPSNPYTMLIFWLVAYNMPFSVASEIARKTGKLDRSRMRFSFVLSLIALPIFIVSLIWTALSPVAVLFVTFCVIAAGIAVVQHNFRDLALQRAQAQQLENKSS